jgi:hypothetical protein
MTLDDEALCETELAGIEYLGFVASGLVPDGNGRAFSDHPKVLAGDVELKATGGTYAAASWGEAGCQGLVLHALDIKSIRAKELLGSI